MADAIVGNTELSSSKQDLIASIVQRELQAASKLMPTITDVSSFAVKGAKSISFPRMDSFTATNRASGAAGDATLLTAAADQLDLNQTPYVAWLADPNDVLESTLNFQLEAAKRAASAQGRFVDANIAALYETIGVATATVSVTITRDIILEMRKTYLLNDGLIELATLVIDPTNEGEMLKIAEFTRADMYGSSNIPAGVIGQVYGVPVLVSNRIDADEYYLVGKDSSCVGFQAGPQMSDQLANEFGTTARRYAMDQKFGSKGLQLGEKGVGAAESPLLIKDGNV